MIGWNLVLELAMGAAVVAKGWSSYLGTVFDSVMAQAISDRCSSTGVRS